MAIAAEIDVRGNAILLALNSAKATSITIRGLSYPVTSCSQRPDPDLAPS
jgi:hypothetical protein